MHQLRGRNCSHGPCSLLGRSLLKKVVKLIVAGRRSQDLIAKGVFLLSGRLGIGRWRRIADLQEQIIGFRGSRRRNGSRYGGNILPHGRQLGVCLGEERREAIVDGQALHEHVLPQGSLRGRLDQLHDTRGAGLQKSHHAHKAVVRGRGRWQERFAEIYLFLEDVQIRLDLGVRRGLVRARRRGGTTG